MSGGDVCWVYVPSILRHARNMHVTLLETYALQIFGCREKVYGDVRGEWGYAGGGGEKAGGGSKSAKKGFLSDPKYPRSAFIDRGKKGGGGV